MLLRTVCRSIFCLAVALFVGCGEHTVYELTLEPGPEGLRRTLVAWREEPVKRLSDAEVDRLAALYPERVGGEADIRQEFRGTYRGPLPADVGGAGSFQAVESPLGVGYTYLERFRGTLDQDSALYDRRAAVDRFCDLLIEWADKQLEANEHRAAVRRFLQQEFRQDARNVAAILALEADEAIPEAESDEVAPLHPALVKLLALLVERGYFEPHEPALFLGPGQPESKALEGLARRAVARRCGFSRAQVDSLYAALPKGEAFAESWRSFLKSTPEYALLVRQGNGKPSAAGPAEEPDALGVLTIVLEPILGDGAAVLFARGLDVVRIRLKLPQAPYQTSGSWSAHDGEVRWTFSLRASGGRARVCYAAWSAADAEFQNKHFGKLALADAKLARFAVLYQLLEPRQREELADHLRSLEPGDAIKGRARDFQLIGAADDEAKATVAELLELLAENL
ncbi:MAG: hypothetical protein JNL96_14315 [Planctomycetaceae bacterium]|nr:hypothetical protein [Planctomycetaceae bacterium]